MEIKGLTQKKSIKTFTILVSITIFYMIYRYQGSTGFFLFNLSKSNVFSEAQARSMYYQWTMAFLLLGVFPGLIVKIGFREPLRLYGLCIPKPFQTFFITLVGILIATPIVYLGSKRAEFNSIYPLVQNAGDSPILFIRSSLFYFLYYIGYEFCFRGFLFMGIRDDIGDAQALGVSLAATVLLHVTQPQSEMIMAFVIGIAFPLIVRKLKSLWPAIMIHAYAGIALDYWCIINRGGFVV